MLSAIYMYKIIKESRLGEKLVTYSGLQMIGSINHVREPRSPVVEQSEKFVKLHQYKLLEKIGQGSYGLVKLAYSEEDSTHYAMKILSKRKLQRKAGLMQKGPKKVVNPLERVYREIAVLKKLDHPNIVRLIEVLDDPLEDSLYMVFQLVRLGEVLKVPTKNPLDERRVWTVFRDTILGLEYLHFQKIIHGDLKPSNLLLTETGNVKIADLGVCNEFFGDDSFISSGSLVGTPAFRAPETLNLAQAQYCGKAADIWSLGITLFALVFGNVPFLAQTIPVLYEKIKNDSIIIPQCPPVSDDLKNFIEGILNKSPALRFNLPQIKAHHWVTSCGEFPLPTEQENCQLIQVNEEELDAVVKSIPKLDTLILIKTMLKKHSFGNPFSKDIIDNRGGQTHREWAGKDEMLQDGQSNSSPDGKNAGSAGEGRPYHDKKDSLCERVPEDASEDFISHVPSSRNTIHGGNCNRDMATPDSAQYLG